MIEDSLKRQIQAVAAKFKNIELEAIELSYPDPKFGDFTTNIALKLAAELDNSTTPRQIAEQLAAELNSIDSNELEAVEVAGPGFINIRLSTLALGRELMQEPTETLLNQLIVIEFSDPNPFKQLHAGHFYTSVVGDSIARLLEAVGAKVKRLNYGSDVGLHVGKTLWGILAALGGEHPEKLNSIAEGERSAWMSRQYVLGNKAFDSDAMAKATIYDLNKRVYGIFAGNDHDSPLARIYWTCRQWSYDAFDQFYASIHITFDRYYPESRSVPISLELVKEQLARGVFEKSDGAVIFRGDKYALHTRVFINSQGLPTYEAKDIGTAVLKSQDYDYDRSIIITGNEIEQYLAVVYKAIEQFRPDLSAKTLHLPHGMVRLAGGKKMGSRLGNVVTAEDVLTTTAKAALSVSGVEDSRVVLGAIKYSFLKQRLGGDIVYEPEESVNILGNSGPYLQYAHARAKSILAKASKQPTTDADNLTKEERALELKLSRFAATINQAAAEMAPHILCIYLYELSQVFNRFYEVSRVVGDEREAFRLFLVKTYADRLRQGLSLLGIEAPDKL